MGQIVKITCNSCKKEWERKTGCGILHADLARIAQLYPPQIGRKIREYGERTQFPLFDFGFRLSYCDFCSSVESVPVLEFEETGEVCIGRCPHCMQEVKLIGEVEQAECPACHEQALTSQETGLWD